MDHIEKLEKAISEKQDKIKRLEGQREKRLYSNNKKKRKERTRQLIQMGALAEKYYGIHDVAAFEKFNIKDIIGTYHPTHNGGILIFLKKPPLIRKL